MNLDTALRALARVVERGSMTAAARDLGASQPAISKIVSELEKHVGARLLARSSRVLKPTAHGLALYQATGGALASIDAAIEAVRSEVGGISGTLNLHAPVCLGERHLTRIVLDFQATHPGVSVRLALEDRPVDLVKADLDLAFRVGSIDNEALVVRRIGASRRCLVATEDERPRPAVFLEGIVDPTSHQARRQSDVAAISAPGCSAVIAARRPAAAAGR